MKNILITGGAGFIGSNLALELISRSYKVTVLDNLSHQIHGNKPDILSPLYRSIKDKVRFIEGSVESKKDWIHALKGQDAVIHLAAETGTGQSMYQINKYTNVNIGGTALFLDILANSNHSIKKIIVASSRAVYGEGKYYCENDDILYPSERLDINLKNGDFECKCPICNGKISLLPTDEESKISPTSIYGITKQNQEQMVLIVGKSLKIPSVAFRYQNVYGPGQSLTNPYTGILSIFSTQIKNGNDINIFEDGLESRDFVYIKDVVNATILGLEKEEANYEVFNVGSGQQTSVIKVAKLLIDYYKVNVQYKISGNYRLGDIRHNYADISKIKDILGYSTTVDFNNGIRDFCDWVNTQKINNDKYELSIQELKTKGFFK